MTEYSFVIIHGLGGSGPDHWQTWLANSLKQRNYNVIYPAFSKNNHPIKEVWLQELKFALESVPKHHKKIIITHSLGGLLWQHYAAEGHSNAADQVVLVAPPSPTKVIPAAKSFYPVPLSEKNLNRVADNTFFVHSTNDPYCSIEDANHYLRLGAPSILFPNMGHINVESGYDSWPWILDQCERIVGDPKAVYSI